MSSTKPISIRGKTIHLIRVKHARTFGERFRGLMGVSPNKHDYALVFHMEKEGQLSASIHMLFMKMPIDVIWLNARKEIVDIQTLQPWAWNYTPAHASKYVVELPVGTLPKTIRKGMGVQWPN